MMPTPTYELIASNVLSSSASSVTFSSIPTTYRDLILIATGISGISNDGYRVTLNNDNDSVYGVVGMEGTGSSASTKVNSGQPYFWAWTAINGSISNIPSPMIVHIMDYSSTDKHKTCLFRINRANGSVNASVGTYQKTNIINLITISLDLDFLAAGSTFYLYGVKA